MPTTAQELLTILTADAHLTEAQADAIRLESLNTGTPIESLLSKRQLVPDAILIQAGPRHSISRL